MTGADVLDLPEPRQPARDNDPDPAEIWTGRHRLPAVRWHTYTHDGRITDVALRLGENWPDVTVVIVPRGLDIKIEGRFRADGRLRHLAFTADDVVPADLRRPAVIRTLREWHVVAREAARQILAGVPEPDVTIDLGGPAEALRSLVYGQRRKPGTRKRGPDSEQLLADLADAYRQAVAAADPAPRRTLAARFGYSPAHIGHLLMQARQPRPGRPPLLGPAIRGKPGEARQEAAA